MDTIMDTLESTLRDVFGAGLTGLGNLIAALLILFLGYIIARLVAGLVRRLLKRVQVDNRIADRLTKDFDLPKFSIENLAGTITFWLIILFFIGAAVQQLNLALIAAAINPLLARITSEFLPGLMAAVLLVLIAWIAAVILKAIVVRICGWLKLDDRLTKHGALHEEEQVSVTESLGTLTFWLVILLFIPAILEALGISAISAPFLEAINAFFGYLPNIASAVVILLVGYLIARVLRQLVVSVLTAVRLVDDIGERIGLTGEQTLSKLLGTVTYAVVMIMVLIAALDALAIEAISEPATSMLNIILTAIPSFIGAVLVLLISYFIARLVSQLIVELLTGFKFDSWPAKLGINYTGTRTPSQLVGYLVILGIMLIAAVGAADLLNSAAISAILSEMVDFFFQVVLALVIIGFGLYFANLAADLVKSASGENGRLWATATRAAILILTVAMALRQLGLATDIVNMAFGFLLAAIAFAVALSFGLGTRDIAGREMERVLGNWRGESSAAENAPSDEA